MNVVWQGDEIAFQGLFKHYIYVLTKLYLLVCIAPKDRFEIEELSVFLDAKELDWSLLKKVFKSICNEFFASPDIAQLPIQMAHSKKKFTSDEILCVFRSINLYAYLVIDGVVKAQIFRQDVFNFDGRRKLHEVLKNWTGYTKMLELLINNKSSIQEKEKYKYIYDVIYKYYLKEGLFKSPSIHTQTLTFDFPEMYMKNINQILYKEHSVACFSRTYQNDPMWTHYANNENGICLEYKVKKEQERFFLHLHFVVGTATDSNACHPIRKWQWAHAIPVDYANEYPEIDFFHLWERYHFLFFRNSGSAILMERNLVIV